MPIFEYAAAAANAYFETIVLSPREKISLPALPWRRRGDKQLSAFAASAAAKGRPAHCRLRLHAANLWLPLSNFSGGLK